MASNDGKEWFLKKYNKKCSKLNGFDLYMMVSLVNVSNPSSFHITVGIECGPNTFAILLHVHLLKGDIVC